MLYRYEATTPEGDLKSGNIDAANRDIAISALQRRNLIISKIEEVKQGGFLTKSFGLFQRIKNRDIVILSRQLSTLFEAKVPALTAFRLLSAEIENTFLREKIFELISDIQGGVTISEAMAKQPAVFSKFFVSMVRAGEESGKLDEVFSYLATYLERNYEFSSKARGALVYPAFVIVAFIGVMTLMMTVAIPKLTAILKESGQELPIYTKIIIGVSDFLVRYGVFLLIALGFAIAGLWYYHRTPGGKSFFSRIQVDIPYFGNLYRKIYISRIMNSLETLLSAGISAVRSLELTADMLDNDVYKEIVSNSVDSVKGGSSISDSFSRYEEMPGIVVQMLKVGEETGKLAFVFKTLAGFYTKEVDTAIGALLSLIEPALIILLGLGVGVLVAGVLGPIYGISSGV